MSAALRRVAVLPTPLLAATSAVPLLFSVGLGLAVHRHRTRKTHR